MIWAYLSIECHLIVHSFAAGAQHFINQEILSALTHFAVKLWRMDECLRCLSLHLEGKFERPCKAGISRFVSVRWRHEASKIPEIESKPPLHLSVWAWKVPKLPLVRLRVEHSGRVPPVLLDQDGGCTMETAWNSMFMRFHLWELTTQLRTDSKSCSLQFSL